MLGKSLFIVAEISANHGNDINIIKKAIKKAKEIGCDAVKIQTYTPDTITLNSDKPYFQIDNGTIWDGATLYELYETAYTPWEWHKPLFEYAKEIGICLFSTPFDFTAVDLLEECDNPIYKIASFEINDLPLVEYVASKGKPLILSTGIATEKEIKEAIKACRKVGNEKIYLLKCTSEYPAKIEDANLLTMVDMKGHFNVEIGLSDHTIGNTVAIAATALGAKIIEKHFILDKSLGGPDASFSMEPDEFKVMIDTLRQIEKTRGVVNYELTDGKVKSRKFSRSLFVAEDVTAGDEITTQNVKSIRPSDGMEPKYLPEILGKKFIQDVEKGMPLTKELFDWTKQEIRGTLVEATIEDADLLFEWANDDEVRKNSFNKEKIVYEDHQSWLKKALDSKMRYIYIYYYGDEPVGQIRIDLIEDGKKAEIGYSIDKAYRGKGHGTQMLILIEALIECSFPQVKWISGKVLNGNAKSERVFEKKYGKKVYSVYEKRIGNNCI